MAVISQVPKTWTQNPWQPDLKPVLAAQTQGWFLGNRIWQPLGDLCAGMGPEEPTTKERRAPSGGSDSVLCTWPAWPRLGRAPWLDQPSKGWFLLASGCVMSNALSACPALPFAVRDLAKVPVAVPRILQQPFSIFPSLRLLHRLGYGQQARGLAVRRRENKWAQEKGEREMSRIDGQSAKCWAPSGRGGWPARRIAE